MMNLYISHFFVQHGFAVLRYGKRGTGESTRTYPDIDVEHNEVRLNDLADDTLAGVEFLKDRNLINPDMNLAGFSQGGWVAPLATPKSPDVAFAISLSGSTSSVDPEIYYSDLTGEGISLKEASDM
jgi:alpha/beta superfamily hydrolase